MSPDHIDCDICGWSRIILDGETPEDARRAHEGTAVHAQAGAQYPGCNLHRIPGARPRVDRPSRNR